jgi:Transcriptional regulator
LPEQYSTADKQSEERDKRQERANRILDAARELVLRYGYKKTTIDDIARQAGVAKGTIYLHWKSREDLFIDLVVREKIILTDEMQKNMLSDSEGFSFYTMVKYSLLAFSRYPLLKALILQDHDTLGELTNIINQDEDVRAQYAAFEGMLLGLRKQHLIRTDQSVKAQMNIIYAVLMGFITYSQYLPALELTSDEENAELAAETLRRALALQAPDQQAQDDTRQQYAELLKMAEQYRAKKEHLDE